MCVVVVGGSGSSGEEVREVRAAGLGAGSCCKNRDIQREKNKLPFQPGKKVTMLAAKHGHLFPPTGKTT